MRHSTLKNSFFIYKSEINIIQVIDGHFRCKKRFQNIDDVKLPKYCSYRCIDETVYDSKEWKLAILVGLKGAKLPLSKTKAVFMKKGLQKQCQVLCGQI